MFKEERRGDIADVDQFWERMLYRRMEELEGVTALEVNASMSGWKV
jgi:hypothetical protein